MKRCDACSRWIVLRTHSDGQYRYCTRACQDNGPVQVLATQLPASEVRLEALRLHRGRCDVCQGPGPVDVHCSFWTVSFIVLGHWWTRARVRCRACGLKSQAAALVFSFVFGWWSWIGILATPVQLIRNLKAMLWPADKHSPSAQLESVASLLLAQQRLDRERERT